MPVRKIVEFNAPPDLVYPWVADPELSKQWLKGLESTVFEETPPKVGTQFVQRINEGGRIKEYAGVVTARKPDHRFSITLEGGSATVAADYQFDRLTGDRTRLTYTCDLVNPSRFARVLMFLFAPVNRMLLNTQMRKLKELVEGRTGPRGRTPGAETDSSAPLLEVPGQQFERTSG